jgi:hypothetical protein
MIINLQQNIAYLLQVFFALKEICNTILIT